MNYTESKIQQACVTWFRLQYPDTIIASFMNAGKRKAQTGTLLRLQGMQKGMPDLFITSARDGFHGLFIEMKSKTGQIKPEQKAVIQQLKNAGYMVAVCRSFDEFQATVNNYMGNYF